MSGDKICEHAVWSSQCGICSSQYEILGKKSTQDRIYDYREIIKAQAELISAYEDLDFTSNPTDEKMIEMITRKIEARNELEKVKP